MQLEINVVDAFTDTLFNGNPAAVIITPYWLADELMQLIAMENNLSETAFLVADKPGHYAIRWFSPLAEIAFCGHATLACAFVLFGHYPALSLLQLTAKAVGQFSVTKTDSGKLQMDFPNTKPAPVSVIPASLLAGLSIEPREVYRNAQAYFVVYQSESEVRSVLRDNDALTQLAPRDVVVTCRSDAKEYDFISRYFWPANGGDEDPVTGSIHTGLAPLWAERLGKPQLVAYQASHRGGIVYCEVQGDRVLISGHAKAYMTGVITL